MLPGKPGASKRSAVVAIASIILAVAAAFTLVNYCRNNHNHSSGPVSTVTSRP